MLYHCIKLVFHNITRNKFYSFLNIIGLTVGLVSAVFIMMYILDELSYDRYNVKHDRIYRIQSQLDINGKVTNYAKVSGPYAQTLKEMSTDIEKVARFRQLRSVVLRTNDRMFTETAIYFADQSVFDIFTYRRIYGNLNHALISPFTAVLTRSTSKRYFGEANPVGKFITTTNNRKYLITAVIEDVPYNSHLKFDGLFSLATYKTTNARSAIDNKEPWNYWFMSCYSYLLMKKGTNITQMNTPSRKLFKQHMEVEGRKFNGHYDPIFIPITDLHLNNSFQEDQQTGNRNNLFIFLEIAMLILMLASINYMNLATARSVSRTREVGIRKMLGSIRMLIIRQFIIEALIFFFIATISTLAVVELLLPSFNYLVDKDISFNPLQRPMLITGIFLISAVVGIISGFYPANYLSRFEPVFILRGNFRQSQFGSSLRKGLVTLQLVISISLTFGALCIHNQYNFLINKNPGFDLKNVVTTDLRDISFFSKYHGFREALLKKQVIIAVTTSSGIPGNLHSLIIVKTEHSGALKDYAIKMIEANDSFFSFYKLSFASGRIPKDTALYKKSVVINETAALKLGWQGDAIGKRILIANNSDSTRYDTLNISGVVRDFNFSSFHNAIDPLIIFISMRRETFISVKSTPASFQTLIPVINSTARELGLKTSLNCMTLADILKQQYTLEYKLSELMNLFAILSVFIAAIGLLGLSSFSTEKMAKENGIRKVLGATPGQIAYRLFIEVFIPVIIAYCIAVPVAWFATRMWLTGFAFHYHIGPVLFFSTALLTALWTLFAMSFHILRSSFAKPFEAVKYE
jgi:putative ABC transport system permease protein